ncbi:transmembrane protein dusky [Halictus rubicundus]|uniref:transmembrane protein dusky n=1 Tax=Halictus rubicundus TaxID=77578 RepID=UPI004036A54D
MRWRIFIFACLLLKGLAEGEDVEVVEAIPGEDNRNDNSALNRQDNDINTPDQLALESLGEKDAGSNHYKPGGLRGHPLPMPPSRGSLGLPHPRPHHNVAYHGPPPPLPPSKTPSEAMDKIYTTGGGISSAVGVEPWPAPTPDMPKIISLDVKCEKNLMKVYLGFDKPFYGIVFSKGHYSNVNCVHLPAGLGRTSVNFEISIHACGTAGNTENGLYGYGAESGSGTYFENIIVVQYDPQVQEVWDQARKLRCTWHDLYEKSVTFRPFPVDMLDVVRADFAGDNVGCWMQIQVGRGPWASEVSGLVKIGQTMTMVLAIKDDDSKFDMLVRNCMAHDGKRAPIQLVDQRGCITRPKLMSRFTKIKNFGASASVLSYAHFQAFKFPDSMEVHFQCTIQICRYQCPEQCSESPLLLESQGLLENHHHSPSSGHPDSSYGIPPPIPLPLEAYLQAAAGRPRDERRRKSREIVPPPQKAVGVNRIIRVVSTGDLTFSIDESNNAESNGPTMVFPVRNENTATSAMICMTTPGFAITLIVLLAVLLSSCILSTYLCLRLRPFSGKARKVATYYTGEQNAAKKSTRTCFYS